MANANTAARELWDEVMGSVPDGRLELGPYFTHQMLQNPFHILFTFARYKFAARLLGEGRRSVLELGCNEGLGTLMLAQAARNVLAVDFDENAVEWAQQHLPKDGLEFLHADFLGKRFGAFDAIVMLDVIEHLHVEQEPLLIATLQENLADNGICIVGTPNLAASRYASRASRIGHVNLYDEARLRARLSEVFRNVFVFSCNDEMVHTGFYPFAHYLIALCIK